MRISVAARCTHVLKLLRIYIEFVVVILNGFSLFLQQCNQRVAVFVVVNVVLATEVDYVELFRIFVFSLLFKHYMKAGTGEFFISYSAGLFT